MPEARVRQPVGTRRLIRAQREGQWAESSVERSSKHDACCMKREGVRSADTFTVISINKETAIAFAYHRYQDILSQKAHGNACLVLPCS